MALVAAGGGEREYGDKLGRQRAIVHERHRKRLLSGRLLRAVLKEALNPA